MSSYFRLVFFPSKNGFSAFYWHFRPVFLCPVQYRVLSSTLPFVPTRCHRTHHPPSSITENVSDVKCPLVGGEGQTVPSWGLLFKGKSNARPRSFSATEKCLLQTSQTGSALLFNSPFILCLLSNLQIGSYPPFQETLWHRLIGWSKPVSSFWDHS